MAGVCDPSLYIVMPITKHKACTADQLSRSNSSVLSGPVYKGPPKLNKIRVFPLTVMAPLPANLGSCFYCRPYAPVMFLNVCQDLLL